MIGEITNSGELRNSEKEEKLFAPMSVMACGGDRRGTAS